MDYRNRLAAAPHAVQVAFNEYMSGNPDALGREMSVLFWAQRHPADLMADRANGGDVLWSDQEIISILTEAAEIDTVSDRALGTAEIMRLQQREMIRKALKV
jgi:hypothetical protein